LEEREKEERVLPLSVNWVFDGKKEEGKRKEEKREKEGGLGN